MNFEEKKKTSSLLRPGVLAALWVGAPALAIILWQLGGCRARFLASRQKAPSVFAQKGQASEAAPLARPKPAGAASSLEVLPWYQGEQAPAPAAASSAGPAPAAGAPASPGAAEAALAGLGLAPAAPPPAEKLAAQEEAALRGEMGVWNPEQAASLGSKKGLLFQIGKKLLRYPKVVGFVLNNDLVVKGFMSQDRVRQNCNDPKVLMGYLSNRSDPSGITMGLASIRQSLDTPGSAQALFSSKLVGAVLSQCSSIAAVTQDKSAVMSVAAANPDLISMMVDPRLVQALAASPAALQTFSNVQSAVPGPAPAAGLPSGAGR